MYANSSVAVDPALDTNLGPIMTGSNATEAFPEAILGWAEEGSVMQGNPPASMGPLMIKWCLNLRMTSTAAYHNLRMSGMLVLPSERTLRDYSNVVKGGEGFNLAVIQQLFDEARNGHISIPYHRQFCICNSMHSMCIIHRTCTGYVLACGPSSMQVCRNSLRWDIHSRGPGLWQAFISADWLYQP